MRGKYIYSPYELYKSKNEYYFIIAVNPNHIRSVRMQLMVHGIDNYGIFICECYFNFLGQDEILNNEVMKAINEICFEDEPREKALPLVDNLTEGDGTHIGKVNWLLNSTMWSHYGLLWAKEIIDEINNHNEMLEIGPGYGLLSLVLLHLYKNLHIDWCLFGENSTNLDAKKDEDFCRSLYKIKNRYINRISEIWGYIELNVTFTKKYDLIIMTEVFEHFGLNPVNTMIKIREALSPDGKIILTTPNWGHVFLYEDWKEMPDLNRVNEHLYFELADTGEHIYQYSYEELSEIFEKAGLEIVKYNVSEGGNHNFMLERRM